MASRPAWTIRDGKVIRRDYEFAWNGGFAITQKQKNIRALHKAILDTTGETAIDISSKSTVEIGVQLSAFNLKLSGVYLENIFQSAKKYEHGGPYLDLLECPPKDAKRDERHTTSGKLVAFEWKGEDWELEPKTLFYDFIYLNAVSEKFGLDLDLSEYQWFTDIEFNPAKSINCQARAAAIYKLIQQNKLYEVVSTKESWVKFHKEFVIG
jgi:type I restriction enzyme M protein